MKRFLSVILSVLTVCTLGFAACTGGPADPGNDEPGKDQPGQEEPGNKDPELNETVPADSITLEIKSESNGNSIYGIGVELDPHFHSGNVGRTGERDDGTTWECKAEDWETIYLPRMQEMNLKRLRVMLMASWYVDTEVDFENRNYTWDSVQMQSLYKVLDAAQQYEMDVNITMWGVGSWMGCDWMVMSSDGDDILKDNEVFAQVFADGIKHLIVDKGYTCVKEITPFNEPNSVYDQLGKSKGFPRYAAMCTKLDEVFRREGIRSKVKFNLSDDARDATWLEKTLDELKGIYDIVNSHTYDFKIEDSNDLMLNDHTYAINNYTDAVREFGDGVVHMFGEFGTGYTSGSHSALDRMEPSRGLLVARIAINMLRGGSSGFSYWPLFSEFYSASANEQMMDMGLWGFADEDYHCRPVFYAYTLFTRFAQKGMEIFPIDTDDENIAAVALKGTDGKWSYFVVNNSETESKKVSFLNRAGYPETLAKYVYDQNNVPTDDKVLASSGNVTADGRVVTDTVKPLTFAVYTNL